MRSWHSWALTGLSLVFLPATTLAQASSITEGFDDITTLAGNGWFSQNNSNPVGSTGWFQGNPGVFVAHSGATSSYLAANFNNAGNGPGLDTISNWMLTPVLDLSGGGTITFFTRTIDAPGFPDRLQVRYSNAGASTDVGVGEFGVGDFTNLVLDINPNYNLVDYPNDWTQFIVNIPSGADGRVAFRYFVEDAGPLGNNSDFIGIDTFTWQASPIPEPSTILLLGLAGAATALRLPSLRRKLGQKVETE